MVEYIIHTCNYFDVVTFLPYEIHHYLVLIPHSPNFRLPTNNIILLFFVVALTTTTVKFTLQQKCKILEPFSLQYDISHLVLQWNFPRQWTDG